MEINRLYKLYSHEKDKVYVLYDKLGELKACKIVDKVSMVDKERDNRGRFVVGHKVISQRDKKGRFMKKNC